MKLLLCRTIILYLCVLFAMRLMGKRQLGELQPEELVSTILISNLASISIESEDVPITASLIPLFLIAALELLGSVVSFRSQKFFNFLSGRPKTVILDGKIDQNALRMLRLTTADLMEALRGKDIFDPRRVSYAVIETNGTLSAALRPEQEAATLSDLQLKVQQTQATIPFVLDGQVLEDNLRWCGKDRAWLERTATANTVLPQEILLLIGNETEDYFLLKRKAVSREENDEADLCVYPDRSRTAGGIPLQQRTGAGLCAGYLSRLGLRPRGCTAKGLSHCAAGACRGRRVVRHHAGNYEPSAAHCRLHGAGSRAAGGRRIP